MKSKYLVTGATGKLGGLTIKHLIQSRNVSPDNIIALVRDKDKAKHLSDLGVQLREGNYDDLESLKTAFSDVEKVLLISSPNMDNVQRLKQQFNLVIAAYESSVDHIYLVSLANPYNRTFMLEDVDLATEHMVMACGIPYTILRNAVYLDEISNEINLALETGILYSATKNKGFNYVLRDDLALTNATVMTESGHSNIIYELVNSELHNFEEVAKVLSELTGKTITYKEVDDKTAIRVLSEFLNDDETATIYIKRFQKEIAKGSFSKTSHVLTESIGPRKSSFINAIKSIISKS